MAGQITSIKTKQESNITDMNDLKGESFTTFNYFCTSGSSVMNLPEGFGSNRFFVTVINCGSDIYQRITSRYSGASYERNNNSGTWSSWRRLDNQ